MRGSHNFSDPAPSIAARRAGWGSALLLVLALLVAGCGGASEEPSGDQGPPERTDRGTEPAARTEGGTGGETTAAGPGERTAGGGSGETPQRVAVEVRGTEDIPFDGRCAAGGEETRLEGTVPKTFELTVGEEELECRVIKRGTTSGGLEVVLVVDGERYTHATDGRWGAVSFTYSGGSVSSTVRSSGSTAGGAGSQGTSSSVRSEGDG